MIPVQGFAPYFFALFPGFGHFYLRRHAKAAAYGIPFYFIILLFFLILANGGYGTRDMLPFLVLVDLVLWLVCFIDMLVTIQRIKTAYLMGVDPYGRPIYNQTGQVPPQAFGPAADGFQQPPMQAPASAPQGPGVMPPVYSGQPFYGTPYDPERTKLKFMSLLPGLGHFHLGLMQRGMSTMALFFGIIIFIFFIASMTSGSFMAFLLVLPIIWFYTLFDTLNLYKRKMAGEMLVDRSFFEELYENRSSNRRNRTVATLLSIFPGAGHLYLGAQKRGVQLMMAFLASLYLLDVMRLSFFLFLIPILWFFAFFDALQLISRSEQEEPQDQPIINSVFHYRRWIGIGLLLLGLYYVVYNLGPEIFRFLLPNYNNESIMRHYAELQYYLRVGVVALVLIIAGIYLLFRRRKEAPDSRSTNIE